MTSAINPNNIDATYPVAGQPNNTQGFRDNFTATKTNFQSAADEITDLQNKVILKSALTGTTLDNNMNDALLLAAKIQDFSATAVNIATTVGSVPIDYAAGHYQTISTTGNISLSFINWPITGSVGLIRLQIVVSTPGIQMTLPVATTLGTLGIQGLTGNTITFPQTGTFEFAFLTRNGGTTLTIYDLNRPLSYYTNPLTVAANTVSTSTTTGALLVAGGVGVVGNVNAGNLRGSNVTATGYFVGDGGYLSNVTVVSNVAVTQIANGTSVIAVNGSGGNASITVGGTANLALFTTSGASVIGNIAASGFVLGNGSLLTGTDKTRIISGNTNVTIASANGNVTIDVAGTNDVVTVANTGISVSGIVSATGNVQGNFVVANDGEFAGNVAAGNVVSTGFILTSGDIFGGNLYTTGNILSNSTSGGIGFTTGAGTTTTQATNKTTGVTINNPTGQITYAAGNLSAGANVSFTMTNSTIANSDVMIINHVSGGTIGAYSWYPQCNAGNAVITMVNRTAGILNEQPVIRFVVIKGATA